MGRCGIVSVVLLSLVSFVAEVVFTAVVAYRIYSTGDHLIIFCVIVGLLSLLSVVIQLLSWQLHSLRADPAAQDKGVRCSNVGVVISHVCQVGLLWRYYRILTVERRLSLSRRELWETFTLRCVHSLCCSIPVLLLLGYLALMTEGDEIRTSWELWTSLGVCLFSCAWGLATFRKHQDYCCVVGAVFPGLALVFKFAWRLGEVTCRVLTLVMFVQVQGYWVFLLVGGHWITMLVLISVETVLQDTGNSNSNSNSNNTTKHKPSTCKTICCILVKSYAYIFCYLNPCGEKSKFYTVVYYMITCLESLSLLALWIIYDPRSELHIPLALTASITGAVGFSFCALYYSCFHRSGARRVDNTVDTACLTECIDCHRTKCWLGGSRGAPSEDPTGSYDQSSNWEQYIDEAVLSSAAASNRLVAPPLDCHNVPAERDCYLDDNQLAFHNALPYHTHNHNVLLNDNRTRGRGQRSETPLVLMGYEQQAPQRPERNHHRANSLDFLWDNYDLQVRDHMHGVEGDAGIDEIDGIKLPPLSHNHNRSYNIRDGAVTRQSTDQGYYSGISSSSKENSRKAAMAGILERDPVRHLVDLHSAPRLHDRLHCRARGDGGGGGGTGALSDGNTSSYSTTSAIVNCGKCGTSLAIDSSNPLAAIPTAFPANARPPSMYSLASSTSFASSAAPGPNHYPRRRASIHIMDRGYYNRRRQQQQQQRRRRLMEKTQFGGGDGEETLDQAMERIHGTGVGVGSAAAAYRHHVLMSSDVTSSAWDYTDSEI